jgi:hypothetical protein
MMDWVPDRCGLPKRVRPLILSGAVHPAQRWRQETCGSWPRASVDVWAGHQPVAVHVIKRDLLSVHVQAAYHRHRDLLELLKQLV